MNNEGYMVKRTITAQPVAVSYQPIPVPISPVTTTPVTTTPVETTYSNNYDYQAYPTSTYQPYGPNHNIVWPIIGAVIAAIALSLFYILLRRVVNLLFEVWHIVSFKRNFIPQALTFVGGLLLAGGIFFDIFGYGYLAGGINPFGPKQTIERHTSVYGFALAGLLMGFGAKLILGDLHAHGYAQIARHNKRSLVALILFLLFGIIGSTIAVNNFIPIFTDGYRNPYWNISHYVSANICIAISIIFMMGGFALRKADIANTSDVVKQILTIYFLSFIFGGGYLLTGLTRRQNVIHGLSVFSHWSPVLLITVGVTLIVSMIAFFIGSKFRDVTIWGNNYFQVIDQNVTGALVVGSTLFGLGWGLGGMDIASWILHFPVFTLSACLFYGVFLIGGMYIAHFMQARIK